MRTLEREHVALLHASLDSCTSNDVEDATDEECRIVYELRERGLVVACYCDGHDQPHPKVTSLGIVALECAKILEQG